MDTKDILNLVLALSAAVLTAFIAWFLYYVVAIVRELREATRVVHDKVNQVGELLSSIKERFNDSVSALSILTNVVSKVAGSWQKSRTSKRTKTAASDDV